MKILPDWLKTGYLRVIDPVVLGLHGLAAFVALAVALSAASAIRGSRVRPERDVQSLEAA